jgi:flagellar biosynthesis/type III secretory pathway M-ring protein FliF/YscJ
MKKIPGLNMAAMGSMAPIIMVVVVLVVVFLIAKRFGLIKSRTQRATSAERQQQRYEKQVVTQKLDEMEFFSPKYLQNTMASQVLLTDEKAREYAKVLRKAMRGFGTDESAIYGVFRKLKYGSELSQIAFYYNSLYNKDLLSDLKKELNKKELLMVFNIIEEYRQ